MSTNTNEKITWHIAQRSVASNLIVGTYPEGTTKEEVEKQVRGSFGGHFQEFADGRFKYVAYID